MCLTILPPRSVSTFLGISSGTARCGRAVLRRADGMALITGVGSGWGNTRWSIGGATANTPWKSRSGRCHRQTDQVRCHPRGAADTRNRDGARGGDAAEPRRCPPRTCPVRGSAGRCLGYRCRSCPCARFPGGVRRSERARPMAGVRSPRIASCGCAALWVRLPRMGPAPVVLPAGAPAPKLSHSVVADRGHRGWGVRECGSKRAGR